MNLKLLYLDYFASADEGRKALKYVSKRPKLYGLVTHLCKVAVKHGDAEFA